MVVYSCVRQARDGGEVDRCLIICNKPKSSLLHKRENVGLYKRYREATQTRRVSMRPLVCIEVATQLRVGFRVLAHRAQLVAISRETMGFTQNTAMRQKRSG